MRCWLLSLSQEMEQRFDWEQKIFDCVTNFLTRVPQHWGKVTQNTSAWIKLCPIIDKCTSKALGMSLTKGKALWLHKGFTASTVTIQKAIFLASFVLAYLLHNVFFWWVDLICKLKSHCTILKTTAGLSWSNYPVGMSVRYYLVGIASL